MGYRNGYNPQYFEAARLQTELNRGQCKQLRSHFCKKMQNHIYTALLPYLFRL
jgi:hypothetical protein